MSQPTHTPGPVRIFSPFGRPEIVTDRPTAHETQCIVTNFGALNVASNARLLAAAYNAFDSAAKKLSLNAVELAERMADGAIAELFESHNDLLSRFHSCISDGNGEIDGDKEAMELARSLKAKVKGGAA